MTQNSKQRRANSDESDEDPFSQCAARTWALAGRVGCWVGEPAGDSGRLRPALSRCSPHSTNTIPILHIHACSYPRARGRPTDIVPQLLKVPLGPTRRHPQEERGCIHCAAVYYRDRPPWLQVTVLAAAAACAAQRPPRKISCR